MKTLKLRKISRHYRILGSVMSRVFLVSECFKTHIICHSPLTWCIYFVNHRLHSSTFFSPLLTRIVVSAWHCTSRKMESKEMHKGDRKSKSADYCVRLWNTQVLWLVYLTFDLSFHWILDKDSCNCISWPRSVLKYWTNHGLVWQLCVLLSPLYIILMESLVHNPEPESNCLGEGAS